MKWLFFIAFIFFTNLLYAANFAVMDFIADGVEHSLSIGTYETFVSNFKPSGFTLVSKMKVRKTADDMGVQLSTATPQQMKSVMEKLGITHIVFGKVSKIKGEYVVSVNFVKAGNPPDSAIVSDKAEFSDSYIEPVKNLAQKLAKQLKGSKGGSSKPTAKSDKVSSPQNSPNYQAKKVRDAKACEYAREENSVEVWQDYLDTFPDGECTFEAEMELRKMKRDHEEAEAARLAREQAARDQRRQRAAQEQADKINQEQYAMNQTQAASGRYWSPKYFGNWASAKTHCQNLTYGGYSDWHLPTISELRTLVTPRACSRTHPYGECPITDRDYFQSSYKKGKCHCNKEGWKKSVLGDTGRMWSATQSDNGRVWYIYFNSGSIYADNKSDPYNSMDYRCIR